MNLARSFDFEFEFQGILQIVCLLLGDFVAFTRSLENVGADARLDAPERVEIWLNDWSKNRHRWTHEGDGNDERKPQRAGGKPKG